MKKKHIIIISIVAVLLIALIILLIALFRKPKQRGHVFNDSEYPMTYTKEDRNIIVELKDENNPKISWEPRITDESKVTVTPDGKTSGSKVKYVLSAVEPGTTSVDFVKTMDVSGEKAELVIVRLPLYIGETPEGPDVNILEDIALIDLPGVVGADSAYPVIVYDNNAVTDSKNGEDGELLTRGNFFFVNGINDWTLECSDGQMSFFYNEAEDGNAVSVSVVRPEEEYLGEAGAQSVAADETEEPMPSLTDGERNEKEPKQESATVSADNDNSADTASATTANSTEGDASSSVLSSEIVLSSSSLGISESFDVTQAADGTISIEKKNSKKGK